MSLPHSLALPVRRLSDCPELLGQELEAGNPANTLALRVLYGFLTYMDDLEVASPAGTYDTFLAGMDDFVRVRLELEHVYKFVELQTETGGVPHSFFLLLDEFNAVKSEGEVGLACRPNEGTTTLAVVPACSLIFCDCWVWTLLSGFHNHMSFLTG